MALRIINGMGHGGAPAAPALRQAFNSATNWPARCDLAEILNHVDPRSAKGFLPVLTQAFENETNRELRLDLARTMVHLDDTQASAIHYLENLWETDANVPVLRSRAYGCLNGLDLAWTNVWPALVPVLHAEKLPIRTQAAEYLYFEFPQHADRVGLKEFVSPRLTQRGGPVLK